MKCPCCLKEFEVLKKKNGYAQKYCSPKCRIIENQFNYFTKARKKLRKGNTPTQEQASPQDNPVSEPVSDQAEPNSSVQRVVEAFKRITGHRNDKEWDKQFFKRYAVSAKRMIDYLGDYKSVVVFVTETYESLSGKGFSPFTMESLEKHMAPWKLGQLEEGRGE